MYKFKEYTDDEFFNCKLRGANNVVSAVIGGSTDEGGHYANVPPSILEAAARRGKAVHEYIEEFLKTNDFEKIATTNSGPEPQWIEPKVDLEFDIYWYQFMKWLKERCQILEVIGVETKLISEELACKGVIDFIGIVKTDTSEKPALVMVDWKTSSSLDEFRTQCQLGVYLELLFDQYPDLAERVEELRVLQINKSGYRWFNFPIDRKLIQSILYIYKNYKRCDHE